MLTNRKRNISVSGGFFLLVFWFAFVNGWYLTLTLLAAAFLHEAGHWGILKCMGGRQQGFRMSVYGAEIEIAGNLSYGQELAVVWAGPTVNLIVGGLGALHGEEWDLFAGANLVLGGFNLLPIRKLDGGRILYLTVAWLCSPAAGEWAVRWLGGCCALAVGFFLLYLIWGSGGSLWLFPAMFAMFLTGLEEVRGKNSFL